MSKWSSLAIVNSARTPTFAYLPPEAAYGAGRILVKPNFGYPKAAPVTVSLGVLGAVLKGLRRAAPHARILVVEGSTSKMPVRGIFLKLGVHDLLDDNMRLADAEELPLREYPNLSPSPVKYATMTAPAVIADYDCCISVSAFKRTTLHDQPLISASLKNLYGLFPRALYAGRSPNARGQLHRPGVAEVLHDVYFTIGHRFHGAVVDLDQKFVGVDHRPDVGQAVSIGQVVWGSDLLAVDEAACRLGGEEPADYLASIRAARESIPDSEGMDAP